MTTVKTSRCAQKPFPLRSEGQHLDPGHQARAAIQRRCPSKLRRLGLWPLILLFVCTEVFAQTPRTLFEFDPGMTVALDLSPTVRLDFATGKENTDELSA